MTDDKSGEAPSRLFGGGGMERTADISACGQYRFSLTRRWGDGPTYAWVMLNPSTADAAVDDNTVRRCISFTNGFGAKALVVVNLWALRATDPMDMLHHPDPTGDRNAEAIRAVFDNSVCVVAAWGAFVEKMSARKLMRLDVERIAEEAGRKMMCLGITKSGHPRHPLYVHGDAALRPWPDAANNVNE